MRKSYRTIGVAALLVLGACMSDRSSEGRSAATAESDPDPNASRGVRAPTEYSAELVFLSAETGTSEGLVLQLSNYASSSGLRRRYLARSLTRSGWRTLLDAEWLDGPTRAPWRVLPGDSFHLVVTDDGDPDAFVLHLDRATYTLDLAARLDSWEDRRGAWHEIRSAQLVRSNDRTPGIALHHRFVVPNPDRPVHFQDYYSGVLRVADGSFLVIFQPRDPETLGEPFAWMYSDGLTRRWTEIAVETVDSVAVTQLGRDLPSRIRITIAEPGVRGELRTSSRSLDELAEQPSRNAYHAAFRVRGWLEIGETRESVEGVLLRGQG